jgi:acetylornithine deacetylase/succinyl-diaminopimelate desuccinylase-like protein
MIVAGPAAPDVGRDLGTLRRFLAFPTVASDPARRGDLRRCAAFLAAWLRGVGLHGTVLATPGGGPPSVLGSWLGAPGQRTLLVYGHFDVQPPGDIRRWRSPPFEPVLREGRIVARGATDDKGPIFAAVRAIGRRLRGAGALPINVKVWLEGEEEVGSPNIGRVLRANAAALQADVIVVLDSPGAGSRVPRITTALRGRQQLVIELQRPGGPLHSGNHGGRAPEPAAEIARLAAAAQASSDRQGTSVSVLSLRAGPRTDAPTASLPDRAAARLELRLAPGDDGRARVDAVRAGLDRAAGRGLHGSLLAGRAVAGVRLSRGVETRAAERAVGTVFGVRPVAGPSGGTIPFVSAAAATLRTPIVALGLTDPADGAHGPNESIALASLDRIGATVDRLLLELRR